MRRRLIGMAMASPVALVLGVGLIQPRLAGAGAGDEAKPPATEVRGNLARDAVWTTAVDPKPLSDRVRKGLDWLVRHQMESGGWGQGEESVHMRGGTNPALKDRESVADTCIAAIALIRSGSSPRSGPYREPISKAVRFVAGQVEESDSQSISVTTVQGTRVQQKLGPNIDTFLASMLMAEVKGRMPDDRENQRVNQALAKVLDKIKRHQKADGSFEGQGWAPVLAQALCGKGINRARQAGAEVSATVLARAEEGAKQQTYAMTRAAEPGGSRVAAGYAAFAPSRIATPALGIGGGAAGVELYARAASVGVLQDSVNTNAAATEKLREVAQNGKDPQARADAEKELRRFGEARAAQQEAQSAVIARLSDKQFVSGFGSNGGEEFLSYMNLAESLVVKGGAEWKKWDDEMTGNLNRVQNDDGSWSGHHCITGRTFCTSSALLVLMADRTPVPVQAKESPKVQDR